MVNIQTDAQDGHGHRCYSIAMQLEPPFRNPVNPLFIVNYFHSLVLLAFNIVFCKRLLEAITLSHHNSDELSLKPP